MESVVKMEEKWSVDKLDGGNWITLKFQMRHLLLAKGLWKYVDGSETLAAEADERTHTEYSEKSQKALSTLVMAISTSQLYLVTSCERLQDVWKALRDHRERGSLANRLYLKKQYFKKGNERRHIYEYFKKEMKEGTSMSILKRK